MKKKKAEKKKLKKAKLSRKIEDDIDKATKEMEDLLNSIQDVVGDKNIKVVKVEFPRPNFKSFVPDFLITFLFDLLFIWGTRAYISFFSYKKILDIILFTLYYTAIDRVIYFIFMRYFMPLVIKSMGMASFLPLLIPVAVCSLLPIFVKTDNFALTFLVMLLICILRIVVFSFFRNKIIAKKVRKIHGK